MGLAQSRLHRVAFVKQLDSECVKVVSEKTPLFDFRERLGHLGSGFHLLLQPNLSYRANFFQHLLIVSVKVQMPTFDAKTNRSSLPLSLCDAPRLPEDKTRVVVYLAEL